ATARALGLPEEEGRAPEERLTEALSARTLLLVLDNCEHVPDACAALCYHLLSACPGLRVLATSRHVLRVEGEQVYPVPSLALPPVEGVGRSAGTHEVGGGVRRSDPTPNTQPPTPNTQPPTPEHLMEYEAIRLFVQRAVQASPAFKLDRRSGAAVAEICRQ